MNQESVAPHLKDTKSLPTLSSLTSCTTCKTWNSRNNSTTLAQMERQNKIV
jgi:hypothetical protein